MVFMHKEMNSDDNVYGINKLNDTTNNQTKKEIKKFALLIIFQEMPIFIWYLFEKLFNLTIFSIWLLLFSIFFLPLFFFLLWFFILLFNWLLFLDLNWLLNIEWNLSVYYIVFNILIPLLFPGNTHPLTFEIHSIIIIY